jgi:hypothetical protein
VEEVERGIARGSSRGIDSDRDPEDRARRLRGPCSPHVVRGPWIYLSFTNFTIISEKKEGEEKGGTIEREEMMRDISNTPMRGQATRGKERSVEETEEELYRRYKQDLICGSCGERGNLQSKGKVGMAEAKRMGLKCGKVLETGQACGKTVVLHIALTKASPLIQVREREKGDQEEGQGEALLIKELERAHQARARIGGAQGNKARSPRGLILTPPHTNRGEKKEEGTGEERRGGGKETERTLAEPMQGTGEGMGMPPGTPQDGFNAKMDRRGDSEDEEREEDTGGRMTRKRRQVRSLKRSSQDDRSRSAQS